MVTNVDIGLEGLKSGFYTLGMRLIYLCDYFWYFSRCHARAPSLNIPGIVTTIQTYLCLLTTKHRIQVFPMLLLMSFVHFVFVYMLTSPYLDKNW